VGLIALAAIIGGVVLFLRNSKRREAEEEYKRQAAVNAFVSGGKSHHSNSSMNDSRLEPDILQRRESTGSIADNQDYSRRILKVCTNRSFFSKPS
jgi:cell wall integrity and stress response component